MQLLRRVELLMELHFPNCICAFAFVTVLLKDESVSSSQSYGVSLAIWDHTSHPTQVYTPRHNPSQKPVLNLPTWKDRRLS